jgi:putative ABC transport system permease protein
MKIRQLVTKEIFHRKFNFALSVVATLVATASLIGSVVLLRVHDLRTGAMLREKEAGLQVRMDKLNDDTRKSMLKLGFNLVILPKDQNMADWHIDDYSTKYMPESYVDRLANSKDIVDIRHLLPSLQQKVRWPERGKTIILMGTRGEVPNFHLDPQKPLLQPVPPGTIILGYELHRSLNIKVGDKISLLGREFAVKDCYGERGNKDDITAWINLKEAQALLKKEGQINAILALECLCTANSLPVLRKEVEAILPDTHVIERESSVLARAEARRQVSAEARMTLDKETRGRGDLQSERERLASVLTPVILVACALWVAIMGFVNVRSRRGEIGILRTVGVSSKSIFMLFIWKHITIGILGGCIGLVLGCAFVLSFANPGVSIGSVGSPPFWLGMTALAVFGASLLTVLAGWIPSMIASYQDPADVMREE